MSNSSVQQTFDYTGLPFEAALELRMSAERVRVRMKRSAEDIIAIGQELQAAKDMLPHGQFGPWLAAEFDMRERTAQNFMAVAERFGKNAKFADLPISALYLLAAPSTPEPVREAVERGEVEPNHAAVKAAIEAAKEAERQAREEADRLHAELDEVNCDLQRRESEYADAKRRIDNLTNAIDETNAEAEKLRKSKEKVVEKVPEAVTERLIAFDERIRELGNERKQLLEKQRQLEGEVASARKEAEAAHKQAAKTPNERRIIANWRALVTELQSVTSKARVRLPTARDTAAFEAEDWQCVQEVRAMIDRTISDLHRLADTLDEQGNGITVVDAGQ